MILLPVTQILERAADYDGVGICEETGLLHEHAHIMAIDKARAFSKLCADLDHEVAAMRLCAPDAPAIANISPL